MDQRYITLLREELIPALGCTEPIAIAYAAATAARTLGRAPQHILCQCSGNIIKNVKSVSVPNSGSGNQGVTVCLPVWVYAQERKAAPELLYRALAVSNLVAIYQKSSIGRLSAFCGVVGAACGCGAGIAFLEGRSDQVIGNTVINTLGNISGMVCDGAKPSCAAKIASAVDAALLGYQLAQQGYVFADGDGLMKDGIEKTLRCIGRLGRDGMRGTDEEILHLMLEDDAVGC